MVRLASSGCAVEFDGALDGTPEFSVVFDWTDRRTNVGIRTYTHCKPCRASPRYRSETRTNGLLEEIDSVVCMPDKP